MLSESTWNYWIHRNEDFFKVIQFPSPVITVHSFGITAVTPMIWLAAIIYFTVVINTPVFRWTVLPHPPNLPRCCNHFQAAPVPAPSGTTVWLWALSLWDPCFHPSYILKVYIFFIEGTLEEPGVRQKDGCSWYIRYAAPISCSDY